MKVTEVFKTIFARFGNIKAGKFTDDETGESLNDVAKVLSQFNIQLYDAQGNMTDVGDILDKLHDKWRDLTTVEKNALASAIAGTRQRENFIVLMDNYGDAIKYTEEAMNSSGTAMEKYDAYLKSIEASQTKLKATFEDFSQTLVDKGIIKGFYDLASVSLMLVTNLLKLKPVLIAIFSFLIGKASAAIILKIVDSFKKMTYATKAVNVAFKQGISNIKLYIQSLKSTKTALVTTEQAAQIAAGRMALVQLGTTALTAVVMGLVAAYQKRQRQIEEDINQAKEHIETFQEEQKSLEDLKQQYIDLSKSENYNDETRKSIQSIQEEINKLIGKEADGIDLVNGKLDEQIKKLDKISTQNAQNNLKALEGDLLNQQKALGKALFAFGDQTQVFGFKGQAQYLSDFITKTGEAAGKYSKVFGSLWAPDSSNQTIEGTRALLEEYKQLQNEIDPKTNLDAWNAANNAIKELETRISNYDKALNTYNRTQAQAIVGADLFNNKVKIDSKEAYDSYINSLKNAKDENGKLLYSEEAIQAMIEVLSEKFPQFADKIEDTSNVTNALSHDLKSLKDTYETLNSVIDEYNSNGALSYDTWQKLLEVEDKYLAALVDENGQIKANNQALQDLIKTKIEDATLTKIESYASTLESAAKNGTLQQTLLLTQATAVNTNVRLANVMATIASIDATEAEKKQIVATIAAMLKMSSAISIGSDSTSDAKKATEDWEKVLSYANAVLDEQIDLLKEQKEAIENSIEEQIKAKEKEISLLEAEKEALEDKNEEKNKEIELEELQRNLQKAQQRTMRVYHEGQGWVYEQDPEALKEAQQELDEFYTEQQIDNIDKRIEALEKEVEELEKTTDEESDTYDERLKNLDKQIEAAEKYKDKWNEVKTDYEKAQDGIVAKAKLGAEAEQDILNGKVEAINIFKENYTEALEQAASSTESIIGQINTSLGGFDFESLMAMLHSSGVTKEYGKFSNYKIVKGKTDENGVSIKYVLDKDSGRYYKEADLAEWQGEYYFTEGTNYFGQAYASGTLSAHSGLANVDEKGKELIVPKQGRYRMMEYGDTVVPHNLSQRLFDVATNPLRFISNALNSVKSPNLMSNSNVNSSKSTINIGTIELPSVTDGQSFVKQLQLIAANR